MIAVTELAGWLVVDAILRGLTLDQLCDQILREEEAYQSGWNEATEAAGVKETTDAEDRS